MNNRQWSCKMLTNLLKAIYGQEFLKITETNLLINKL